MKNDVTILVPVLNEEQTIGKVIRESTERGWTVLVGDNGSTDSTYDISAGKGVIPIPVLRKGKGHAIRELIHHVRTPITVMIDGDYTYLAEDVQRMLKTLEKCDVVIGCRKYKEKDSMTFSHSFGNCMLSLVASILYAHKVDDVNTGLKAFRTDKLREFVLTSGGFTLEADLFINAVKQKCVIRQVPISYRARPNGSKSKLRIIDGLKIGWFLVKERFK